MTRALALVAVLAATPAVADITPDQLWQALDAIPGVSGKVAREPGRVVVSGLRYAPPQDAFSPDIDLKLATLTLTDTGQGTVEVTASPDISVRRTEDPQTTLTGTIAIPGARAFVSGSLLPGQLWFDGAIPTIRPDLTETGPLPDDRTTISGTLSDVILSLTRPSAEDGLAAMTLGVGSGDIAIDNRFGTDAFAFGLRLSGLAAATRLTPGYLTDPPLMPAGRAVLSLDAETIEADVRAPKSPDLRTLLVSLSGLAAKSSIDIGAEPADKSFPGASMTGDLSLSAFSYLFEPGEKAEAVGTSGSVRGRQSDFTLAGRIVVPARMDNAEVTAALNAGLAVDLRMGFGAGESEGTFPIPDTGRVGVASSAAAGSLTLSMSRSGLLFDLAQRATTAHVSIDGQPALFDGVIGDIAIRLAGPLVRTAAAQPFDLVLRLADATASDAVWAIFDPGATIPRDPATLSLRLSGTAEVTGDVLATDRKPDDVPLRLRRLDLTELALSAGGARIDGSGALDVPPGPAAPVPAGRIDLTWKGVYALLDKLSALGLVPQDAALGIRGGLGMIARPVGSDDLKTRFDFRPDGKVLANGVAIPGMD